MEVPTGTSIYRLLQILKMLPRGIQKILKSHRVETRRTVRVEKADISCVSERSDELHLCVCI